MKCQFEVITVPADPRAVFSPMVAEVRCVIHNMQLGNAPMTADSLCPIGQIEVARDEAIARINEAKEQLL